MDIKIYQIKTTEERKKQFPTNSFVRPTSEDRIGFNDCSENVLYFTVVTKHLWKGHKGAETPDNFIVI